MFPYKFERSLSTGKVTSHLSYYLSCEGDYRENDGESLTRTVFSFQVCGEKSYLPAYALAIPDLHIGKNDRFAQVVMS